jgi:iron complex transport system permease protein
MNGAVEAALFAALLAGLLCVILLSVNSGAVRLKSDWIVGIVINKLSGREIFTPRWPDSAERIVWQLRFPRALASALAGASLALSGVLTQALTKNALADPFILGVSSGASTGAVAALLLGGLPIAGRFSAQAGAFGGALLASALVFALAGARGGANVTRLVLTGVAAASIFTAFTNLLIFITPDVHKINTAMFWMTGSLAGVDWEGLPPMLAAFLPALAAAILLRRPLDALLLGDERALTLGVDTKNLKYILIVVSSLLTGVVVSITGVVGFVGLIVPHVTRSVFGAAHRRLLPAAALSGGIFLCIADVLARVLAKPEEMPVGIITAFTGAPFFLFLLRKTGYKFGE